MALITCPECSKEISDKASACPHCGYPLAPGANPDQRYSLVLLDAAPNLEATRRTLCKLFAYSEDEAQAVITRAPVRLFDGLPVGDVFQWEQEFSGKATVKVLRDEDAHDPETMKTAPPVLPPKKEKEQEQFPFWAIVGAVVVGVLIISLL